MCTLSWHREPAAPGYRLFFNRDEQKSREAAEPPGIRELAGVRFTAPRDGRAGGTWITTNEHGLTVALLNHYQADTPTVRPETATSRGQLVVGFAACESVEEFRSLVARRQAAGRYPAFFLFALDLDSSSLWRWDGHELTETGHPAPAFLTTSSVRTEEVLAARQHAFSRCGGDLAGLHLQHDARDPAASIRMRRPDARTVSRSEVRVAGGEVLFRYSEEATDELATLACHQVSLALATAGH